MKNLRLAIAKRLAPIRISTYDIPVTIIPVKTEWEKTGKFEGKIYPKTKEKQEGEKLERYSKECNDCPYWKYQCWMPAPGSIEQVKKCSIYTAHREQVACNWQAIGIKS